MKQQRKRKEKQSGGSKKYNNKTAGLVPRRTKKKKQQKSFGQQLFPVTFIFFVIRLTYLSCFGFPLDVSELISELISFIPNAIKVLFLPL